ncbi:MAG: hypothetical protein ACK5YV_12780 [Betaproteobacteria bacterium]|jgi:nucleoside diphosphate kinase
MTTAQKLQIETAKFVGQNILKVTGNDIAKFYTMEFTSNLYAQKVAAIFSKLNALVNVEGSKLTMIWTK